MANNIPMNMKNAIQALHQQGHSIRKISRQLGIHRNTVKNSLAPICDINSHSPDHPAEPSDPTSVEPKLDSNQDSKCTTPHDKVTPGNYTVQTHTESPQSIQEALTITSNQNPESTPKHAKHSHPTNHPNEPNPASQHSPPHQTPPKTSSVSGPTHNPILDSEPELTPEASTSDSGNLTRSHCHPYHDIITAKIEHGLSAMRIWQDICQEHDFKSGYQSVKRYVATLTHSNPKRIYRMECLPGEEAQVDYGTSMLKIAGKRKKIHLLRVTLSHSRKGYTEAMPRQDTESFIRGIENALRYFGGSPQYLLLDNLKAGVKKPDIYDPELNPKFAMFCKHYNIVALPTKVRTPQHKGKVESAVKYIKENAVKGREFESLGALNHHLRDWEKNVADQRIHGTTKRQVIAHFTESEKPELLTLPDSLFPSFREMQRKVSRDSYIEFDRSYYEVPAEYISRQLWVRYDGSLVRIYNLRMEKIGVFNKQEPGKFSRILGAVGTPKAVANSLANLQIRASEIGPETDLWTKHLILKREGQALRTLLGIENTLRKKHSDQAIENACAQARIHGQYSFDALKKWLDNPAEQQLFSFMSDHAIIRNISDYGEYVPFEKNN